MEVAGLFIPILSVFAPLLKSRFFGFYVNGITLANREGLPLMREVDFAQQKTEGETLCGYLSPPVTTNAVPAPSSEGAFCCILPSHML